MRMGEVSGGSFPLLPSIGHQGLANSCVTITRSRTVLLRYIVALLEGKEKKGVPRVCPRDGDGRYTGRAPEGGRGTRSSDVGILRIQFRVKSPSTRYRKWSVIDSKFGGGWAISSAD
jgi:hypothetical protein